MNNSNNPFRLNVGFLINQSVGYSRDFLFDLPNIRLAPDFDLFNLSGIARVTRTAQGLLVQTRVKAELPSQCSRCLNDCIVPLESDFTELYAFSRKTVTESGLLLPEDGYIDLTPLVREVMQLAVPISALCSPDCKGLCPVCGENLNETTCDHHDESGDPRLEVLRFLLDADD